MAYGYRAVIGLALVAGLTMALETANAQNYLTDLGTVAPGLGINNSGQVVLQNYFYSDDTLTAFPSGFTGAAISTSGVVAGFDFPNFAGATYSSGTVTDISGAVGSFNNFCYGATGINDSGDVVGWDSYFDCSTDLPSEPPSGWTYSNGKESGIPILIVNGQNCHGGYPQAINDGGQVTGGTTSAGCEDALASTSAYIYQDGTSTLTILGSGWGYAINASGEVTGTTKSANQQTGGAFLYSNGALMLLPGGANCTGYAINASGLIVGTCNKYAFFYNGTTIDLNTLVPSTDPLKPYVALTDARGINDSGLVVVNGVDSRDKSNHAYLLQVSSPSSSGGSSKGGGAFDSLSLIFLLVFLGLRQLRRNGPRPRRPKFLPPLSCADSLANGSDESVS